MKKILFHISLCLSICMHAQTLISPQEMSDGYVRQYINKEAMPDLANYDIVYFVYEDEQQNFIAGGSNYAYMQPCVKLRNVGDITLPPSVFLVIIKSWTQTDGAQLYWAGARDKATELAAQSMKDQMKNKYGSVAIGEGHEAIPAKWFTGDIYAQYEPIMLGGYYMSTNMTEHIHIDNSDTGKNHVEQCRKPNGKMISDFFDIMYMWRHGNRASSAKSRFFPQQDNIEGAIHLLARDLRDIMDKGKTKSDGIKLYNIVLTHDERGNTVAMAISLSTLSQEDKVRIKRLNDALKKLPPHSIGDIYTIDGRLYPGICVDATYDNGLWWMEISTPEWK